MNKLLNNLERKFGRYAIPRLTFVMICCYVVGYMLQLINPNIAEFMTLEPGLIMRGEESSPGSSYRPRVWTSAASVSSSH